ncbi:hypothetical protein BGW36DRAFT_141785 [Talaromyces proteolyticus]|uniref:Uncharacterized protein n=1 Tax=Talaromyces proteolyticus TaxID=1131652 RepID=A0AAD4Q0S2_9EURO|nr:uncharacterized protein BGW36DRAFT_141785 [Talaromyces proteolyticus]KAH8701149.1 hypothetical protein BGW36DRAFT_141785 [Talaromyces proteolyticus]
MAFSGQFLCPRAVPRRTFIQGFNGIVSHLRCYSEASRGSNQANERTSSQPRPRAVDARSLAASHVGSQGPVLRPAQLRLRGPQFANRRRPGSPLAAANRKPRLASKRDRPNKTKRSPGEEEGGDAKDADIEGILNNKTLQVPVRYTPVQHDTSNLNETWPSLPIGKTATTESVLEKLNFMSRRYANGYMPPQELAKRLFDGDRVFFRNEEEKKETIDEFKKLSQERADKLTQRKGDIVEAEDANFTALSNDDRDALVGQLVRGNYARWTQDRSSHPVLGEVERQLLNNETYRFEGKQSGFVTKFQSLLASGQPAKRRS